MIMIQLISGFMIGFEIIWGDAVVFDLGIVRLIFYHGDDPDGFVG